MASLLTARRGEDGLTLDLHGQWRVQEMPQIDAALEGVNLTATPSIILNTAGLKALDLSSAWRLHKFVEAAQAAGSEVSFRGAAPDQLRVIDQTLGKLRSATTPPAARKRFSPLGELGRETVLFTRDMKVMLNVLGRVCVTFVRGLLGGGKALRLTSVTRHIYDTGITAVPIVGLIAFLISIIVAYMSAEQLRNYGADVFVVDLVTIGVLRELGVLLTAIIVAGRSGSSFAAEIGAMQLNEEIDALKATAVDPYEALVVPRVLGLVIALPLLTVIADFVGLLGGALLTHFSLGMSFNLYWTRVHDALSPSTFWVGLIKAPVFALMIALAGCMRGMQVRGSSRELGYLTTVAVVQAIFMVILVDALFAVLFMEMDI